MYIVLLVRYYFVLDLSTNNAWIAISLQQNLLLMLDTHIVSKLFLTIKNHFSKPHIIVLAKSLLLAMKTTLRIIIYVLQSLIIQLRLYGSKYQVSWMLCVCMNVTILRPLSAFSPPFGLV